MTLLSPHYLLLIPLVLLAARRYEYLRPALRLALLMLMVLALAEPAITARSAALDLWVLVDRSASASTTVAPRVKEWEQILERSRPAEDRLFLVDFAAEASLRGEGDLQRFIPPQQETRAALAIDMALSRRDKRRSTRILLLSDGYSTEPLAELQGKLLAHEVALDVRYPPLESEPDFRIEQFSAPSQVQVGEPFLLEARIYGSDGIEVPYEVMRENQIVGEGSCILEHGRCLVRAGSTLSNAEGAVRYGIRIKPAKDAHVGNNYAEIWVEARGKPRAVLVSAYAEDPLVPLLSQQGFVVHKVDVPLAATAGTLAGAKVVILNNVGASELSPRFIDALPFFVREQGGGLLMVGGERSFGSGGYFESRLDPLLPVSMELREEHRRISTAMAVALDRSGSMGMTVSGNMGTMTKMGLANEGAARTVELLGDRDEIALLAVDSAAEIPVPLTTIGSGRGQIMSTARSITLGGGGIFVYEALEKSWAELQKSKVSRKHIILFSDASDSEEPGQFRVLIPKIVAAGGTVSVIGLGSESDTDAKLLQEIGALGKGRVFFVHDALQLPAVFAQETVSVARSNFVKDRAAVSPMAGWKEVSPKPLQWLSSVSGYNLSYLRPGASLALQSKDNFKAPLVAFWQRGVGKVAAVSFPLAGNHSADQRTWQHYGDFVQTLVRWLRGADVPPGVVLRTELQGTHLVSDFYHDERFASELINESPRLLLVEESDEPQTLSWQRITPGHFRHEAALRSGKVYRGVLQLGQTALPFGPLSVPRGVEWSFDPQRKAELHSIMTKSGGVERQDLAKVWDAPRSRGEVSLRGALLVLTLLLFLLEALLTRLNFSWSALGLKSRLAMGSFRMRSWGTKKSVSTEPPVQAPDGDGESQRSELPSTEADAKRRSIFRRAKRKGL